MLLCISARKMRPKIGVVDISRVASEQELVTTFVDCLDLPKLYLTNWHGLAEHFFYDPGMKIPESLTIIGVGKIKELIPEADFKLELAFEAFREANEDIAFNVIYQ